MLGKRASVKADDGPTKRQKVGDDKAVAVSDQTKEEEKKDGRRSDRNVGKIANYNIDDIISASLEDMKGATGSGCISVMLAQTYSPDLCADPTGWLLSEKLDGVRCYWNGSAMYTRNGNPFTPPDWFKKALPSNMALDGELWSKREDFQKIVSVVRRQDKNDEWKNIKYMVFDAPKLSGTFKQRLDKIKKTFDKMHKDDPSSAFL